jgi:hypothetical protein
VSESQEQKAFVKWVNAQYPDVIIYAIPNGTYLAGTKQRRASQMNKLKAEGLVIGMTDLVIAEPRGVYHGFYLEMKDKGKSDKSLSSEQKAMIEWLSFKGYKSDWAAGFDIAREKMQQYMSQPKLDLSAYCEFMEAIKDI